MKLSNENTEEQMRSREKLDRYRIKQPSMVCIPRRTGVTKLQKQANAQLTIIESNDCFLLENNNLVTGCTTSGSRLLSTDCEK